MFWLWLVLVIVLVILIPLFLMWRPWGDYMSGMMGIRNYGWGFWSPFSLLVAIAFLALIALGIHYLVVGVSTGERSGDSGTERSIEILKERYARGEITKEQFDEMKKAMES
jgi:putative membrane protein